MLQEKIGSVIGGGSNI